MKDRWHALGCMGATHMPKFVLTPPLSSSTPPLTRFKDLSRTELLKAPWRTSERRSQLAEATGAPAKKKAGASGIGPGRRRRKKVLAAGDTDKSQPVELSDEALQHWENSMLDKRRLAVSFLAPAGAVVTKIPVLSALFALSQWFRPRNASAAFRAHMCAETRIGVKLVLCHCLDAASTVTAVRAARLLAGEVHQMATCASMDPER